MGAKTRTRTQRKHRATQVIHSVNEGKQPHSIVVPRGKVGKNIGKLIKFRVKMKLRKPTKAYSFRISRLVINIIRPTGCRFSAGNVPLHCVKFEGAKGKRNERFLDDCRPAQRHPLAHFFTNWRLCLIPTDYHSKGPNFVICRWKVYPQKVSWSIFVSWKFLPQGTSNQTSKGR